MPTTRIIGIALLIIGVILLYFGFQSSQGLDDQISEAITGEYTDNTMMYWIASVIFLVLGAALSLSGRK